MILTKEEILNNIKDLINDRKSFLTGDNELDEIYIKDILTLEMAYYCVEQAQFESIRGR